MALAAKLKPPRKQGGMNVLEAARLIFGAVAAPASGVVVLKNAVWTPFATIPANSNITAVELGVTVGFDAGTVDLAIGPGTTMLITAGVLTTPGVFPQDPAAGAPGPSYPAAMGYRPNQSVLYARMNGAPTVGAGNLLVTFAAEMN
jgi:hypothetical protein